MEFKIEVKSISVSHSLELHRAGEKSSHFVSTNVDIIGNVPVDKLPYIQLETAYKVTVSNIYNAMIRGAMTMEDAKERIDSMKENYEMLKKDMEAKLNRA